MTASCGFGFTLLATEEGNMMSFGFNKNGQLGCGNTLHQMLPYLSRKEDVFDGDEIAMVASGNKHGACVTQSGKLWTWGNAKYGRLGQGVLPWCNTTCARTRAKIIAQQNIVDQMIDPYENSDWNIVHPRQIVSSVFHHSKVTMVACGTAFTLALTESGNVWQSGTTDWFDQSQCSTVFKKIDVVSLIEEDIEEHKRIVMIASGSKHMMALDSTGLLWMWGKCMFGELGLENVCDTTIANNTIIEPTAIPRSAFDGSDVVMMDGGMCFTMIVTTHGKLWSCGFGHYGALGLGSRQNVCSPQYVGGPDQFDGWGVRMVACGEHHTLIVTEENKVWSCGGGNRSQLGLSLDRADTLWPTKLPDFNRFENESIVTAAAGSWHSVVVTQDGSVYTWGVTMHPNAEELVPMGLGHYTPYHTPTPFPRLLMHTTFQNSDVITEPMQTRIGHWHLRCWLDKYPEFGVAFAMAIHRGLGPKTTIGNISEENVRDILIGGMGFKPKYAKGVLALLGLYDRTESVIISGNPI